MRDRRGCDAIVSSELDILRKSDAGRFRSTLTTEPEPTVFIMSESQSVVPPKLAADLDDDFWLRVVNDLLDHPKIEHVLPGWDTTVVHLFRYDVALVVIDPFAQ
jgi:hypothetical protein